MVTKAFVAVAGWGTRLLPITKSIEKCMVPLGNRPLIDYVVSDIMQAGIKDIYFIVNECSSQLQSYYSENRPLNQYLLSRGRQDLVEQITPPEDVRFHYIIQPSTGKYGTTIPLHLARDYIDEGESFLVAMGDQTFLSVPMLSNARHLLEVAEDTKTQSAILGVEVPLEEVSKYGIIQTDEFGHYLRIVDRPKPEESPGTLNNACYYLLNESIFPFIDVQLAAPLPEGVAEYRITDVFNDYVAAGNTIAIDKVHGAYLDCGTIDGWLSANEYVRRLLS